MLLIMAPHFQVSVMSQMTITLLYLMIIASISFLVTRQSKLFLILIMLALPILLSRLYLIYDDSNTVMIIHRVLFLIYISIAVIHIYKDITGSKKITRDIIIGAVCEYILIAVIFSYVYALIELCAPGSFIYQQASAMSAMSSISDYHFLYFSVITLSTVGFGDIVAIAPTAKSFVMIESVTGIFYLAVLVSRLVASRVPAV